MSTYFCGASATIKTLQCNVIPISLSEYFITQLNIPASFQLSDDKDQRLTKNIDFTNLKDIYKNSKIKASDWSLYIEQGWWKPTALGRFVFDIRILNARSDQRIKSLFNKISKAFVDMELGDTFTFEHYEFNFLLIKSVNTGKAFLKLLDH